VILGFAAVQLVVHMIYFLHMNSKSEGGWNMMAMLLTVILLFIVMTGSIWVMYHMNANMMPHMSNDPGSSVHGMHDMQ
jgi:cytochrome o ubiquinol oxidase operon protein cyoD